MKVAVFGATGGTGRETARAALAQGHHVTVLVRDPARLGLDHPALTVVAGDVLDQRVVDQVVAGQDVVVVSLGNTPNNPERVVSNGTRLILQAMQQFGVPRLIAVTAIGVGDSRDNVPLAFKMLMKTVLRKAYEDKEIQEQLVRDSNLDWIIVRPGGLTDDPRTGDYTVGTGAAVKAGRVTRADVADFILTLLADDRYLGQAVGIS